MTTMNEREAHASQGAFRFWSPPPGRAVLTGADRSAVALPQIPLPLHASVLAEGDPSDNAIGCGIYDYLRQFPDCEHNRTYAELLRDAFPHYIADLASMSIMLEHKEVDAPYIHRMVAGLKILALLEPDNAGLQLHLGLAYLDLALTFSELGRCRSHLLAAMKHLQHSASLRPDDAACLNALGEIDYLFGDHPAAIRRWRRSCELLRDGESRASLISRLAAIEDAGLPSHPLVDELETIGEAMELYAGGEVRRALQLLEHLEEQGRVAREFPTAQFYFLLGSCREASGDVAGACASYTQSLDIDPDYRQASLARERCLSVGRC